MTTDCVCPCAKTIASLENKVRRVEIDRDKQLADLRDAYYRVKAQLDVITRIDHDRNNPTGAA